MDRPLRYFERIFQKKGFLRGVGMAIIGKQLERAITDNLKERGYSHYSYENYIIIGNNLVAAELIYSTIKKALLT